MDNNNKSIRKIKFYQTNLSGFNIRGGLAIKEKTFIGFKVNLEGEKLKIDVDQNQNSNIENNIEVKSDKNEILKIK